MKAEQHRTKQEKEKCRQRTLESAQAEYEAKDARSFVVALQLEAAGLKRLTAQDKQRGKTIQYVEQSSALGSLLVEREDMQHACGIKVRPNSGKNPEVLRAKSLKTSRQSSLTSRLGRSNSRTSAKSSSRASHKSTKSKAAGRAKSAESSRKGSRNVTQKTTSHNRKCKGKGRGRSNSQSRGRSTRGKTPGSKKRQRPQEQPKSRLTCGGNRHRPRRPFGSATQKSTWVPSWCYRPRRSVGRRWSEATIESCAHRQCQRIRYSWLRTEFCWEVAQIHPSGQSPVFLQLQRPDPLASSCDGLGQSFCWVQHARKSASVVSRIAACSSSGHSHLRSFDVQRAHTGMAETHVEGRAFVPQSFGIGQESD